MGPSRLRLDQTAPYSHYVTKFNVGRYADGPVSYRIIEGSSNESWEAAFSQADQAARSFQMNRGM